MADVKTQVEIAVKAYDQASQEVQKVSNSLSGLQDKLEALNKLGTKLMWIGGIATAAAGALFKVGIGFEKSLAAAGAVMKANAQQMEQLQRAAVKIGSTTTVSAKTAADAMYYLASAGWKTNQVMAALDATVNLAAGTFTDAADAARLVTSTVASFGLAAKDAGRVADVLARATTESQATIQKLDYSLQQVAGTAKSLGLSLEETVSVLGELYNKGLSGERAGTALRNILIQLASPSDTAAKKIRELGLSLEEVDPGKVKFTEIIEKFKQVGATVDDLQEIVGTEAVSAFAALIESGTEGLTQLEERLRSAAGAASELRERIENTNWGKWQQFINDMQVLAIETLPGLGKAIQNAIKPVQMLIDAFNKLPESIQSTTAQTLAWVGVLSLLAGSAFKAATTLGKLGSWIGKLLSWFGSITGISAAIKGLAGATGTLTGTVFGLAGAAALAKYDVDKLLVVIKSVTQAAKLNKQATQIAREADLGEQVVRMVKSIGAHAPEAVQQLNRLAESVKKFYREGTPKSRILYDILTGSIPEELKVQITMTGEFSQLMEEMQKLKKNPEQYMAEAENIIRERLASIQKVVDESTPIRPKDGWVNGEQMQEQINEVFEQLTESVTKNIDTLAALLQEFNIELPQIERLKQLIPELTKLEAKENIHRTLEDLGETFKKFGMPIPQVFKDIAKQLNLNLFAEAVKQATERTTVELSKFKDRTEEIARSVNARIASIPTLQIVGSRLHRFDVDLNLRLNADEFDREVTRLLKTVKDKIIAELFYGV